MFTTPASIVSDLPKAFTSDKSATLAITAYPGFTVSNNWSATEITYIVESAPKQIEIMLTFWEPLCSEGSKIEFKGRLCFEKIESDATKTAKSRKSKASKTSSETTASKWQFVFPIIVGRNDSIIKQELQKIESSLNEKNWNGLFLSILDSEETPNNDLVKSMIDIGLNLTLPITADLTGKQNNTLTYKVDPDSYSNDYTYDRTYLFKIFKGKNNSVDSLEKQICQIHSTNSHDRIKYGGYKHCQTRPECRKHPVFKGACDSKLLNFQGNIIEFFIRCQPKNTEIIEYIFDLLPLISKHTVLFNLIKNKEQRLEVFERLITHKDVNLKIATDKHTENDLLQFAIINQKFSYVAILLKKTQLNLSHTNKDNDTALHLMMTYYLPGDEIAEESLSEMLTQVTDDNLLWQKNNNEKSPILVTPKHKDLTAKCQLLKRLSTTTDQLSTEQESDLFNFLFMIIANIDKSQLEELYTYSVITKVPIYRSTSVSKRLEESSKLPTKSENAVEMSNVCIEQEYQCLTTKLAKEGKWESYFAMYMLMFESKIGLDVGLLEYLTVTDEIKCFSQEDRDKMLFRGLQQKLTRNWSIFLTKNHKLVEEIQKKKSESLKKIQEQIDSEIQEQINSEYVVI